MLAIQCQSKAILFLEKKKKVFYADLRFYENFNVQNANQKSLIFVYVNQGVNLIFNHKYLVLFALLILIF